MTLRRNNLGSARWRALPFSFGLFYGLVNLMATPAKQLKAWRFRGHSFSARQLHFHVGCVAALVVAVVSGISARAVEPTSALSLTKQFVSRDDRKGGPSDLASTLNGNTNFVVLDPGLMAVACERIKKRLWTDLGATVPWRGRILLALHRAEFPDEAITLTSERFADRWDYRLDFPDVTERARFVRAVVQALLMEMANRAGPERCAELPLWLVEGFTRQLLASGEEQIILPVPGQYVNSRQLNYSLFDSEKQSRVERIQKLDPLQRAREVLPVHARLTFEELSWPARDQLLGDQAEVYCLSAQFLVAELLRLPGGQAAMRDMLAQLPNYYNWQFGFLRAYHGSFDRLLDVEKWWALRWVRLSGVESGAALPLDESCRKLDQALHWPARASAGTNGTSVQVNVPLQSVVQDFDEARQKEALQARLGELAFLRPRAEPSVGALVAAYIQTLQTFLKSQTASGFMVGLRRNASAKHAREHAVKALNHLDEQRMALQKKVQAVAAAEKVK